MNNKHKIIFLTISLLIPLTARAGSCVILEEATELATLIGKIFTWSLRIAGLIAFAALIFGGFMYLISGGNESKITKGKNYMTGAALGLIILLGSVLLLNTINPQIMEELQTPDPPDQGICLYDESNGTSTRCCYNSHQKSLPEGFEPETLEFRSLHSNIEGIFWFTSEDFEGGCNYETNSRKTSDDESEENVSGLESFYLAKNKPGVHLYKNAHFVLSCEVVDFPNEPYQRHIEKTLDLGDYKDEVQSVQFKPMGECEEKEDAWVPEITYGAVLHSETDYEGVCSVTGIKEVSFVSPVEGPGPEKAYYCGNRWVDLEEYEIGDDSRSITPFSYAPLGQDTGQVTFFEQTGHKGDRFIVTADQIDDYWSEEIDYPVTDGDLGGVDVIPGYDSTTQGITDPPINRILSMKVEGNFMVVLGRDVVGSEFSFGDRCEAATKSVDNFKGHDVLRWPQDDQIGEIGIIPLK